jgi:hypothetical protein
MAEPRATKNIYNIYIVYVHLWRIFITLVCMLHFHFHFLWLPLCFLCVGPIWSHTASTHNTKIEVPPSMHASSRLGHLDAPLKISSLFKNREIRVNNRCRWCTVMGNIETFASYLTVYYNATNCRKNIVSLLIDRFRFVKTCVYVSFWVRKLHHKFLT